VHARLILLAAGLALAMAPAAWGTASLRIVEVSGDAEQHDIDSDQVYVEVRGDPGDDGVDLTFAAVAPDRRCPSKLPRNAELPHRIYSLPDLNGEFDLVSAGPSQRSGGRTRVCGYLTDLDERVVARDSALGRLPARSGGAPAGPGPARPSEANGEGSADGGTAVLAGVAVIVFGLATIGGLAYVVVRLVRRPAVTRSRGAPPITPTAGPATPASPPKGNVDFGATRRSAGGPDAGTHAEPSSARRSSTRTELQIGSQLSRYRIESAVGAGGMGTVYLATDLTLNRSVAIKVISPNFADEREFRERFKRESRLAALIEHPHVVPVYEADEREGLLFIAMRYVEGTDLHTLIESHGRLSPRVACPIVSQVAAALDAAHGRGLVHRDVKPANVLLTGEGVPYHAYLTDFGLTKRAASVAGLTQTGQLLGTPDYIAPEQIEGPVDARADIYSLGVVLYKAVSGRLPFERDDFAAKLYAKLTEPPPDLLAIAPDLPPALAQVVSRAIARDPARRYPSAGDLGRAAMAAVEHRPVEEPERTVATGAAAPI
jgi:Protein kinase domain